MATNYRLREVTITADAQTVEVAGILQREDPADTWTPARGFATRVPRGPLPVMGEQVKSAATAAAAEYERNVIDLSGAVAAVEGWILSV